MNDPEKFKNPKQWEDYYVRGLRTPDESLQDAFGHRPIPRGGFTPNCPSIRVRRIRYRSDFVPTPVWRRLARLPLRLLVATLYATGVLLLMPLALVAMIILFCLGDELEP